MDTMSWLRLLLLLLVLLLTLLLSLLVINVLHKDLRPKLLVKDALLLQLLVLDTLLPKLLVLVGKLVELVFLRLTVFLQKIRRLIAAPAVSLS